MHEATWEPEENVPFHVRNTSGEHHMPYYAQSLMCAIESTLKRKRSNIYSISIPFPCDLYRDIFHTSEQTVLADKDTFTAFNIETDWDIFRNRHGQGHCVRFPIRLRCILRWSPQKFNSSHIPLRRCPIEMLRMDITTTAM